jgi:hypothetical protein
MFTLAEGACVICKEHQWMKKNIPCPYLQCPKSARGLWIVIGQQKRVVYVRRRIKDEWGLRFDWEKTSLNPDELLGVEDEEDEIVF